MAAQVVVVADVQDFTDMRDYQVERFVRERIPDGTYSAITVNTIQHAFVGIEGEQRARKITLIKSTLQIGWSCFKVFLQALIHGSSLPKERIPDSELIVNQMLRGMVERSEAHSAGAGEIKQAYMKCYRISLVISDDCNHCEVELEQNRYYLMARDAGSAVAPALVKSAEIGGKFLSTVGVPILIALLNAQRPDVSK